MAIYSEPFDGHFGRLDKITAERIAKAALFFDPEILERLGIPALEDGLYWPSYTGPKHRQWIAALWPQMPIEAKQLFLEAQLRAAVDYLEECHEAFETCEVPRVFGDKNVAPADH